MSEIASAPPSRYETLDHWRGFAALWVMIFHGFKTWLDAYPAMMPQILSGFIGAGWLGVYVFFVISGYCITERVAREYRQGGSPVKFMLDRLRRIYPPYWVALLLTLLINVLGALVKQQPLNEVGGIPHGIEWLGSILAVEPWLNLSSYLLVAWTLSYEVGFYLMAAIGLGIAQRLRSGSAGFIWAAQLVGLGILPMTSEWLPLLQLWPHFAFGAVVWVLLRQPAGWRRLLRGALLLAVVPATIYAMQGPSGLTPQLQLAVACAFALIVLQPWDQHLARWVGLRWLGWVGTFSYSLYLIHPPFVGKLRNLLGHWSDLPFRAAVWLQWTGCVLTVAIAWLFYRYVELRCEAWRKSRRPATQASAS